MFGKKKKEEEREIAESAVSLWLFVRAVLVFVEEDPNRVRSFLRTMSKKKDPQKTDVQKAREDMARCIAWASQSLKIVESKLEGKDAT
tara:strand:- start:2981 stop:3244 length:264 start_codon:yes stop_codon:yes gene_type:complete